MAIVRQSQLLTWLNQSITTKSDDPLYQLIKQLIQNQVALEALANSSSGGAGGSIINNIQNILNAYMMLEMPSDGEIGPPGPQGPIGLNAQTIMIMMEEHNEEYYFMRP